MAFTIIFSKNLLANRSNLWLFLRIFYHYLFYPSFNFLSLPPSPFILKSCNTCHQLSCAHKLRITLASLLVMMTQHCASLTHFSFGADIITQSDSIKYFIFNGTIAYIINLIWEGVKIMVISNFIVINQETKRLFWVDQNWT